MNIKYNYRFYIYIYIMGPIQNIINANFRTLVSRNNSTESLLELSKVLTNDFLTAKCQSNIYNL